MGSRRTKLICRDEIQLQASIDSMGWEVRRAANFDCNDKEHFRTWDNELGIIRYLDTVKFRLVEMDDGNPDNPSLAKTVDPQFLPTHVGFPYIRHHVEYVWEGGKYKFHFNTAKWQETRPGSAGYPILWNITGDSIVMRLILSSQCVVVTELNNSKEAGLAPKGVIF